MDYEQYLLLIEGTTAKLCISDEELAGLDASTFCLAKKVEVSLPEQKSVVPHEAAVENWPVWMEVELGKYDSAEAYIDALKSAGNKVSDWARDILLKMPISQPVRRLRLVKVKVLDLGFSEWTTLRDIYARASSRGLDLCPAEVGPAVRLADTEQIRGEWYLTAMEPISDSDGALHAFNVGCYEGGRWLHAHYGHPGNKLHPGYSVVFCLREPLP